MKLCVISGGSAGIGAEAARLFLAAGYEVINLSRRPCPVDGVHSIPADLGKPGFVADLDPTFAERIGAAEEIALIHNAGLLLNDAIGEVNDDNLRRSLEINVVASSALNNAVLPHMGSGSSVIYVGSTLSEKAVAGTASYVIAKHAVVGMMRATCQDLIGRQIHTACVCPGFTDTEMLREHVPGEALAQIGAASTFGRLIQPIEIAETLLNVARSPVLNGAVIHANLGQVEH